MTDLSKGMLEILWHTLGMGQSNYGRSLDWWLDNDNHRNQICTSATNPESRIPLLVDRGLMVAGEAINHGRDRYYHVTADGIAAARDAMTKARQSR